jgi:integrase
VIQQGQVFKLTAKGADGEPLWAYRYRLEGRSSARPQVGGFASRAEAQKALRKALDRVGPGRGGATTLTEFVEEYLGLHQAEPVTIAKLHWLLRKATDTLGEKRIADLSPKDVYAWRLTVPEGHRFEATQALRQVLNRAVSWGLLDFNPAKLGVSNPQRRPKEKRPFESWAQIEAIGVRLGPVYGPMVIFGAATGLRPSELFGLEQHDVDREAGVVYVRRAFANGRIKNTKTRLSTRSSAAGEGSRGARPAASLGQPNPVPERSRRPDRLSRFWPPSLAARAGRRGHRTDTRPLRPAPHLRHLRTPRRRSSVCGLAFHRLEHRDDRSPLRPSGP